MNRRGFIGSVIGLLGSGSLFRALMIEPPGEGYRGYFRLKDGRIRSSPLIGTVETWPDKDDEAGLGPIYRSWDVARQRIDMPTTLHYQFEPFKVIYESGLYITEVGLLLPNGEIFCSSELNQGFLPGDVVTLDGHITV
jgi:hypothetical protein